MPLRHFFGVLFCAWPLCLMAQASTTMVVPNWMPWANEEQQHNEKGLLIDLTSEIFFSVGLKPNVQILPGDRMARTIKDEQAHWYFYDCASNSDRQSNLGEILQLNMVLMVNQASAIANELDMQGKRLSRPRITLSRRFAVESLVGRINLVDSTVDAMRMLKNDRADAIIGSREVIAWHSQREPVLFSGLRAVALADGKMPICLFGQFSVPAEHRQWVAEQIGKLRDNGRLKTIIARYFGGAKPPPVANSH